MIDLAVKIFDRGLKVLKLGRLRGMWGIKILENNLIWAFRIKIRNKQLVVSIKRLVEKTGSFKILLFMV